jgi:hypothetical protein
VPPGFGQDAWTLATECREYGLSFGGSQFKQVADFCTGISPLFPVTPPYPATEPLPVKDSAGDNLIFPSTRHHFLNLTIHPLKVHTKLANNKKRYRGIWKALNNAQDTSSNKGLVFSGTFAEELFTYFKGFADKFGER